MVSIHSRGCGQLQAPVILGGGGGGREELLGRRDSECMAILQGSRASIVRVVLRAAAGRKEASGRGSQG